MHYEQMNLTDFRRILTPLPIIYPEKNLALMFSAKAGCTFAIKWFFHQMGILETASAYHPWVHRYRIEKLYRRSDYGLDLKRLLNNEFTVIKIVRNPYARAVSSYIHALTHGYENRAIAEMLRQNEEPGMSFSFNDFLHYLSTIDLSACNVHHRLQVQGPELAGILKVTEVVKLETSNAHLRAVEKRYGLLPCSAGQFSTSAHYTSRSDMDGYWGSKAFGGGEQDMTYPSDRGFYNRRLKQQVAQLYHRDFEAYGYPT